MVIETPRSTPNRAARRAAAKPPAPSSNGHVPIRIQGAIGEAVTLARETYHLACWTAYGASTVTQVFAQFPANVLAIPRPTISETIAAGVLRTGAFEQLQDLLTYALYETPPADLSQRTTVDELVAALDVFFGRPDFAWLGDYLADVGRMQSERLTAQLAPLAAEIARQAEAMAATETAPTPDEGAGEGSA
jgi:hypothetical protein